MVCYAGHGLSNKLLTQKYTIHKPCLNNGPASYQTFSLLYRSLVECLMAWTKNFQQFVNQMVPFFGCSVFWSPLYIRAKQGWISRVECKYLMYVDIRISESDGQIFNTRLLHLGRLERPHLTFRVWRPISNHLTVVHTFFRPPANKIVTLFNCGLTRE